MKALNTVSKVVAIGLSLSVLAPAQSWATAGPYTVCDGKVDGVKSNVYLTTDVSEIKAGTSEEVYGWVSGVDKGAAQRTVNGSLKIDAIKTRERAQKNICKIDPKFKGYNTDELSVSRLVGELAIEGEKTVKVVLSCLNQERYYIDCSFNK